MRSIVASGMSVSFRMSDVTRYNRADAPNSSVVVHELDVVAVGVEHVGAVVALVVDRTLAQSALVAVAGVECCPVEGVDASVVTNRERHVERLGDVVP